MVNLESSSFSLGDYSVLHDIFLPNSSSSVDPKLVLRSSYLPTYSSPLPSPGRIQGPLHSPGKIQGPLPSPAPLKEVGYVSPVSPAQDSPATEEELSKPGEAVIQAEPTNSPSQRNSSPIDIINLAAEEIKRPVDTKKEEKGRVAWNLAGLVSHLQPEPALPHPYPGYAPPPHAPGYAPHLPALPSDVSTTTSSYNFAAAMGVSAPPGLTTLSLTSSTESPGSSQSAPNPPYKMEPMDTSMYYQGGQEPTEQHNGAPTVFQSAPLGGVGGGLEHTDVMQTLHQYLQPSVDMPHDPLTEGSWLDHTSLHPGLFPHQEYDYSRCYTDRKKKIIREWNKNNSSPRPSETLTSGTDPLRHPYMGAEFLQHSYPPYGVKDEPLRADYYSAYAAYGEGLVNPYAHMGRREKRKKQDSIPGGNTMTRDERKATAMGLPITCTDIINLPMDEFNDLLSKHELTEEQLTLCRDIRRRGKNKVAAQNCRKRKIDQIKQLETEVTRIKCRKTELVTDHEKLLQQRATWTDLVKRLHDYVLKELGHDPAHWQLHIDHSRQVHILPRGHVDPSRNTVPLVDNPRVNQGIVMEHNRSQGMMEHELQHHQDHDKNRAYNMGLRGSHGQISHPVPLHPVHPT